MVQSKKTDTHQLYKGKTMKTKHKLILIISIILIIAGSLIYYKFGPVIKGKIYNGNRITLDLRIFLDDKELNPEHVSAVCTFENEIYNLESENGKFQTKGGNYGEYRFKIVIPVKQNIELKNDLILNLNFLNANDWYISESDCSIHLYTNQNNTFSGNAVIETKYNDKSSKTNKYDINEAAGEINLNWGL